ncbi:MAG: hypothetical protein ACTSSP_07100 [Candidatus Asgardarchaeia archaeon]
MSEKVCPECGGIMRYDRNLKIYICQNCGLTATLKELDELIHKFRKEINLKDEEDKSKKRKEYLKWWLSREKG